MNESKTIELVEMTPEEKQAFEAFKNANKKKEELDKKKLERITYKDLVNEAIYQAFPELNKASIILSTVKASTLETFRKAMEMKAEIFGIKDDQKSHTFTNNEGNQRIIIGYYTTDGYRDTATEGMAIVKECLVKYQESEKMKAFVRTIMRFMSGGAKGNLKPSKVLELEQAAIELADDRLLEGVVIIKEAYLPSLSKQFIRCEYKNEYGLWINIPLGITES